MEGLPPPPEEEGCSKFPAVTLLLSMNKKRLREEEAEGTEAYRKQVSPRGQSSPKERTKAD